MKLSRLLLVAVAVVVVAFLAMNTVPGILEPKEGIVVEGMDVGMTVTRGEFKTVVAYFYNSEGVEYAGECMYMGIYNANNQLASGAYSGFLSSGTAITLSTITSPGTYTMRIASVGVSPTIWYSAAFEVV